MLATQQHHTHDTYPAQQQQFTDNLAVGEDRICPGCKQSAVTEEGGLVVAFGSSFFHVDCFRCAKCSDKVTADTNLLLLSDGSPICANCSYSCNVCKLPILDEAIMTGDDSYHAHCFKCKVCKNRIDELVFAKTSQGIYCMDCHNDRMIRIRKHTQKKAEREKEKERERKALNGTHSTTSSREKDSRAREEGKSAAESSTPSKLAQPTRSGSLRDRVKPTAAQHNGVYVADAFESSQKNPTHNISVTVAPPQDSDEAPNSVSHPVVFQPPPRVSSVDQERSTPLRKQTAPTLSSLPFDDRTTGVDNANLPLKPRRSSSGAPDASGTSASLSNGSSNGLGITSKAEKRRSINPGLALNTFKAQVDNSSAPSTLSPGSATFAGNHGPISLKHPAQNGTPTPLRDSFGSSHSRSDSPIPSRARAGSSANDDQTVVIRPPIRPSSSDSVPTRYSTPTQTLRSSEEDQDSHHRLSHNSKRSSSASRSRPNSRADVPHGIESSTESESEAHESAEGEPPALPPKETFKQRPRDNSSGSDVHPLADLLSLKSDEQGSINSQNENENEDTPESSPVEQTSHATFIAPALPPIRLSLTTADFSEMFSSVSGLPPLQQLAHLASVTEQRSEGDESTPTTPPPAGQNSTNSRPTEGISSTLDRDPGRRVNTPPKPQTSAQALKPLSEAHITITPPEKQDSFDLVLSRLQEVLTDATDRGAQQLKLDRSFVDAIIKAMRSRKEDYSELKGNLDGIKRASKQYMDGLTVAQTEYDRELKQRRELEAEVTRLRVLLSGQAARLTALSGDSRRQELRQQMTKELNKNLTGLEQDISKLKVERDMTLAEMEELSATKSAPSEPEPATNLSRSFTKRLDTLKSQYQRELVPLNQQREALSREIAELKAARDIFLEETTVLNARNEELAQLSAQYSRRVGTAPGTSAKSEATPQKERTSVDKEKTRPPPITIQHSNHNHTKFNQPPANPSNLPPVPNSIPATLPPQTTSSQPSTAHSLQQQPVPTPPLQALHSLPPPPAHLNLPQAADDIPDQRGTPSKGPRFGMKWGSRSREPLLPPVEKQKSSSAEHNFQVLSLLRFTRCDHCGDKMWGSQLRCAGCSISVHTRCVNHVNTLCSHQSNGNAQDDQPLPPSMFGRDLIEQVRSDARGGSRQVPVIVEKCIQAVEALGMDYEGIYRKTGGSGQSRTITQLFERGDYDAFDLCDDDKFNDICSVTSVMKTYLRSLPIPLLTHDLHDHFMSAVEIRDVPTKNSTLTELINKLPSEHYHTLRMLMLHLYRIRERSEVNLMNARNLGVVFGPTLMRSPNPGAEFSDMAGKALSIEWMVENAQSVFV